MPTAVIETGRAIRLLTERRPRLDRWPGAGGFWDEFAELLRGCGFRYLKLDLADMDPWVSDLTGHLTRALRWFDSHDDTDFAGFAEVTYFDSSDEDAGCMRAAGGSGGPRRGIQGPGEAVVREGSCRVSGNVRPLRSTARSAGSSPPRVLAWPPTGSPGCRPS